MPFFQEVCATLCTFEMSHKGMEKKIIISVVQSTGNIRWLRGQKISSRFQKELEGPRYPERFPSEYRKVEHLVSTSPSHWPSFSSDKIHLFLPINKKTPNPFSRETILGVVVINGWWEGWIYPDKFVSRMLYLKVYRGAANLVHGLAWYPPACCSPEHFAFWDQQQQQKSWQTCTWRVNTILWVSLRNDTCPVLPGGTHLHPASLPIPSPAEQDGLISLLLMMLVLSSVCGRRVKNGGSSFVFQSLSLDVPISLLPLPLLLPLHADILWWAALIKDWRGFAMCRFQRSEGRKL